MHLMYFDFQGLLYDLFRPLVTKSRPSCCLLMPSLFWRGLSRVRALHVFPDLYMGQSPISRCNFYPLTALTFTINHSIDGAWNTWMCRRIIHDQRTRVKPLPSGHQKLVLNVKLCRPPGSVIGLMFPLFKFRQRSAQSSPQGFTPSPPTSTFIHSQFL